MELKKCKEYYLSVEGETEKWYFECLKELINDFPEAKYKVKWEPKIQKSPLRYAKTIALPHMRFMLFMFVIMKVMMQFMLHSSKKL